MQRPREATRTRRPWAAVCLAAAALLLLPACLPPGGTAGTVAEIPGYQGNGAAAPQPLGYTPTTNVVTVALGETDPKTMYIHMSQPYAPEGKVSFVVTNEGTEKHEFVVLQSKTAAADFPVVSFEGEKNRINEDAKGVVNVGETGDMEPGSSKVLTIDMKAGHYAVVCNLPGHYAMGMHQDFWAIPKGSTPVTVSLGETDPSTMYIHLSQPYAPQGPVSFIVTNEGTETHEFVVLQTKTPAADFPIVSFEGEANRINEDAKGVVNVGETGDMDAGTTALLNVNMTSEHYAVVCNLPGHYRMGMHQDFWATPGSAAPVTVALGETDPNTMYIHMSQPFAESGSVSFLVTNEGKEKHEFVVLQSKTAAADFPIVSFEGEANRINEDAKGVVNVGETGDMEPGASMLLTIDMKQGHYAVVCNLPGHYANGMHADFWVTPAGSTPVTVSLGETDSSTMFIDMSQPSAPSGSTSFIVTNTGKEKHEFVVLQSKTAAADFPIVSFEGEKDRINEDAKGVVNVGETGDMEPGSSKMLTIDLKDGHYAVVCNLPGHYRMGMHQDFWATPGTQTPVTVSLGETNSTTMFINLSRATATSGSVTFLVTNTGKEKHEFVVLETKTRAADFPIVAFEGEQDRINEDAKGVVNVGETGDMEPGMSMALTIDLKDGHYAVVCNLPGHYRMGMHQDFWVVPA